MTKNRIWKSVAFVSAVFIALLLTAEISFGVDFFVGSKEVGGSVYSYPGDKAMGMIIESPGNVKIHEMYAHVYQVGSATSIRGVFIKCRPMGVCGLLWRQAMKVPFRQAGII